MKGIPALFPILVLALLSHWVSADVYRIGVLAHRGPEKTLAQWQPTADYLTERLPAHEFVIQPLTLEGMRDAVRRREVDFIVANGALYIELSERFGVTRTATLINGTGGNAGTKFGAVIFTRADRRDIQQVSDLKDKVLVAVSPHAWGGWLMPRYEIAQHGIQADDFRAVRFSGYPFDRLVDAVIRGEADAGVVRSDLLESLAAEGRLRLDELRVLGARKEPGFPYLLSTPLYPEHAFASLAHVDPALARQVTAQLLLMPADSPAAHSKRVSGWTTPLSYQPIREVLRALRAPPYDHVADVKTRDVLQRYWAVLLIILLLLTGLAIATSYNRRLARRIRSQAEVDRTQTQRRQASLLANLPGMAYRCENDRDWTTHYVSEGCLELTGHTTADLIDNARVSLNDLIHPDDRARIWDEVQTGLNDTGRYVLEYRLVTRAGQIKWVWERGAGIYGSEGELLALEGIILDNDARKRAELSAQQARSETERLLEKSNIARQSLLSVLEDEKAAQTAMNASEKRFRTIFEQAAVGVALIESETGRFLRINQRYCDIVGYSPEEMCTGKTFHEITHPDDLQADLDNMQHLKAGEIRDFSMDKRYYHKDGSIVWVRLTVSPTWSPGEPPQTHIAVVEDIGERKRHEENLLRSEARLAEAQAIAHVGSFGLHIGKGIINCSEQMFSVLGLHPENQLLDFKHFLSSIHDEDREPFRLAVHQAMSTGRFPMTSVRYLTPHRVEKHLNIRAKVLFGTDGRAERLVGTVQDVTDLKQSELDRARLQRELQQAHKLEAIGQLTGGIAHDFNNILGTILGYSELAISRFSGEMPDKLKDYLAEIRTAGERARDLIGQMLQFARKNENPEPQLLQLPPLVKEVTKMLRATLPTSIQLVTEIAPDLPSVRINPIHIHQLLMNLVINAKDALIDKGTIQVTLDRISARNLECSACHRNIQGPMVVLSVRDDGSGVSPEIIDNIFNPFFTTKEPGQGTGMGLATVQSILKTADGHITVDSTPGAGSAFRVYLPVARPGVESDERRTVATAGDDSEEPSGRRLVVIDDEESMLGFMEELLRGQGYRVEGFADSEAGWLYLKEHLGEIDLLITDQTMPNLTGVELAKKLTALGSSIPVLLVTGYSDVVDENNYRELGINGFISKPVDIQEVLGRIEQLVSDTAEPIDDVV